VTAEEKEEEAKEKDQVEFIRRVARRLIPTVSSRLVTKLWVSGREIRGSQRERASRSP
jgi:hypothetical protein